MKIRHCSIILIMLAVCSYVSGLPDPLTARQVGQYAGGAWIAPGETIPPGSTYDRTNPLRFTIRSMNVNDDSNPEPNFAGVRDEIIWGQNYTPKRTMLPRINFWDGADRYSLPMRDISVYKLRLDHALEELEPVMDMIHGVCLSEENVPSTGHTAVLSELYWYVKNKYPNLPVYQWWTPNTAIPDWYEGIYLPADGWIIDPYSLCPEMYPDSQYKMGPDPYQTLIRKYYVTGLPVVTMLSASSESFGEWYDVATSPYPPATMWQIVEHQREINKAFNLPTSYYWANAGTTYFPLVTGITLLDQITADVRNHCLMMSRFLSPDWKGDPSVADIWTGHDIEANSVSTIHFRDDFARSTFIDNTSGNGFRDLIHNGYNLRTRGFDGRNVNASIVYKMTNNANIASPEIKLKAVVKLALNGKVKLLASVDNIIWPVSVETTSIEGDQNLSLVTATDSRFHNTNVLYVKIQLTGLAGTLNEPAAIIDDFSVSRNCGFWGFSRSDFNLDCYVNLKDFTIFADQWLKCTLPTNESCTNLN